MIKVSHEVPISLLEKSKEFNSFEYCLIHLLYQYPDYKQFYINSRKLYDREVLLDNSIFELGKAFDSKEFTKSALEIQPNMFIVPDVLENGYQTVNSWKEFKLAGYYGELKSAFQTKAIGVVQGNSWNDLLYCYNYMSDHADMLAISFDYSYYQVTGEGNTELERMKSGRQRFITQLIDRGVWNWNKPHHCLGSSLPQEFNYYTLHNIYNIKSVDTSNPVVHGLHNIKYNGTFGLDTKIKTKLADLVNSMVNQDQLDCIMYNVNCFRQILDGAY